MLAPEDDTPDVLPPAVNQALAALWILLMGGRWLATPFLMKMNEDDLIALDRRILAPCYLVLLIVTLSVLALRFARQARNPKPPE